MARSSFTRRGFLKSATLLPVYRYSFIGTALLFSPRTHAIEPITTISSAIGVIQSISAATRGDGGLGAALNAINGKLDIAILQLSTIQKSLEVLISMVSQLKKEIFEALSQQYLYELHNEVLSTLRRIADIHEEARIRDIPLSANNEGRGELIIRLRTAYNDFESARSRLRTLPEGSSSISSSICAACLAADGTAFGSGLISETGYSIALRNHIDWLKRMINPNQPHSIPAALTRYRQNELELVSNMDSLADDLNAPYAIASALYKSPTADLCASFTTTIKYVSTWVYTEWVTSPPATMTFVITFSREEKDEAGAKFITNIKEIDRSAKLDMPDSLPGFKYGKAATQDPSQCPHFHVPMLHLDYLRSVKVGAGEEAPRSARLHNALQGTYSDHMIRNGTYWRQLSDEKKHAPVKRAQEVLDPINLERLKQRHEEVCLSHVVQHLQDAISWQSHFAPSATQQ